VGGGVQGDGGRRAVGSRQLGREPGDLAEHGGICGGRVVVGPEGEGGEDGEHDRHGESGPRVPPTARAGPDLLRDRETGTRWDLSGRAIVGPLTGAWLTPLRYVDTYWFAWVALHPGTAVWPALAASACSR
jgi:hypothetical protein